MFLSLLNILIKCEFIDKAIVIDFSITYSRVVMYKDEKVNIYYTFSCFI